MEPGTKYCIDHPDIRIPEYAEECPICNKQVVRHKRLAELDEPALCAGEAVKAPLGKINEKVEAKRHATPHGEIAKSHFKAKK